MRETWLIESVLAIHFSKLCRSRWPGLNFITFARVETRMCSYGWDFPSAIASRDVSSPQVPKTKNTPQNKTVVFAFILGVRDYCQFESFDASCGADEVILMKSARYGRMRVGRCVARDYGYITCAADVLEEMDKRCSASKQCHFNIPTLRDTYQPCPKDLTAYLEASYSCVKGMFVDISFESCLLSSFRTHHRSI